MWTTNHLQPTFYFQGLHLQDFERVRYLGGRIVLTRLERLFTASWEHLGWSDNTCPLWQHWGETEKVTFSQCVGKNPNQVELSGQVGEVLGVAGKLAADSKCGTKTAWPVHSVKGNFCFIRCTCQVLLFLSEFSTSSAIRGRLWTTWTNMEDSKEESFSNSLWLCVFARKTGSKNKYAYENYDSVCSSDCEWRRWIWVGHQGEEVVQGLESHGVPARQERGVHTARTLWTHPVPVRYLHFRGHYRSSRKLFLTLPKQNKKNNNNKKKRKILSKKRLKRKKEKKIRNDVDKIAKMACHWWQKTIHVQKHQAVTKELKRIILCHLLCTLSVLWMWLVAVRLIARPRSCCIYSLTQKDWSSTSTVPIARPRLVCLPLVLRAFYLLRSFFLSNWTRVWSEFTWVPDLFNKLFLQFMNDPCSNASTWEI